MLYLNGRFQAQAGSMGCSRMGSGAKDGKRVERCGWFIGKRPGQNEAARRHPTWSGEHPGAGSLVLLFG